MDKLKFYQSEPSVVKALFWLLFGKWSWFKASRLVSRSLRETMEGAGLVSTGKDDEGNVIITYPRVEIKMDEYNFYVRFHLLPGQTTRQWESKVDAFGHSLSSVIVSSKIDRGIVDLTLQHTEMKATEVVRKNDEDHYLWIGYSPGGMLKWKFDELPHLLVVGVTGAGKSTFLRSIISQIPYSWTLRIVDGKQVEFVYLKKTEYCDVTATKEGFLRYLDEAVQEMERRYDEMVREDKTHYTELGLKPYFLICDEWISLVESLEKKGEKGKKSERELMFETMKTLMTKGRAAGVFVVAILQRPDAEFLSGVVRDQFTCRVVLKGSKMAFQMAFGDDGKDLVPLGKGQGYCQFVGEELRNFSFANYTFDDFVYDLDCKRRAVVERSCSDERVEGVPEPIGG
jgi:energy-coupling factor transporter ATP-binding protein EcfA2